MNNRLFWNEALRYGAILGVMMGVSHIIESYIFCSTEFGFNVSYALYVIEFIAVVVLFVMLLYKFAKRHAAHYSETEGFAYSRALSFMLIVVMLAGVIVGVMHQLYIAAIGYDVYVEAYIQRMAEMSQVLDSPENAETFGKFAETVREQPAPSMFESVFASMNNYLILGGLLSLILAFKVKRLPR